MMSETEYLTKLAYKYNVTLDVIQKVQKAYWGSIRELIEKQDFESNGYELTGNERSFSLPKLGMLKFKVKTLNRLNRQLKQKELYGKEEQLQDNKED